MDVRYYIKHPNGRERISPDPASDAEAVEAFYNHWTARPAVNWSIKDPKRVLIKEVREEIEVHTIQRRDPT